MASGSGIKKTDILIECFDSGCSYRRMLSVDEFLRMARNEYNVLEITDDDDEAADRLARYEGYLGMAMAVGMRDSDDAIAAIDWMMRDHTLSIANDCVLDRSGMHIHFLEKICQMIIEDWKRSRGEARATS